MIDACGHCLRRSHLIAHLAPRIAGLLDRPRCRPSRLLALDEDDLIAAVAGERSDDAHRFVERFEVEPARARLEAADTRAVCVHSDAYPRDLDSLEDRPAVLFWMGGAGRLEALQRSPAVAVVGARRASPYGLEVAYELGRGLGAAGITVVSGLALGIDAAVHRGVVDAAGAALAVLACGPDIAYPRINRGLYERVRETGAVVSELPPGQRSLRWSFPARNRIMAGLARLLVVVEAASSSGSLITAEFAADLGRDVAAVPGRVTASGAVGSNRLLADGARVVLGAEDVLDVVLGIGHRPAQVDHDDARDAAARLPLADRRVLEGVEEADGGVEALGRRLGLAPRSVRSALGRLEALGLIARDSFGVYERRAM